LNPNKDAFFLLQNRPDRLWGPPSLLFSGYRVHSQVIKWKRREADHSPLSNAEVKDGRRYTASPLYALMVWTGRTLPCYNNGT